MYIQGNQTKACDCTTKHVHTNVRPRIGMQTVQLKICGVIHSIRLEELKHIHTDAHPRKCMRMCDQKNARGCTTKDKHGDENAKDLWTP